MNAEQALVDGIYNQFTADSGSGGIFDYVSGEMHEDEAPERTAKPYVVYWVVTHEGTWMFNEDFEEFILQFNCYAATRPAARIMKDRLTALYDYDSKPTVSGYTVAEFNRTISHPLKTEDFHMVAIQYEVVLQKS